MWCVSVGRFCLWCPAASSSSDTEAFRVSLFNGTSNRGGKIFFFFLKEKVWSLKASCSSSLITQQQCWWSQTYKRRGVKALTLPVTFQMPALGQVVGAVSLLLSRPVPYDPAIKPGGMTWREIAVPRFSVFSAWLNVIYLFLIWQGSFTVKITDQKDMMIRGGIVLFGIKLCNQ